MTWRHARGNSGWRMGKPRPKDVVSGLVTGLFSIPEGMAYASIGGFNPVLGLYAGIVPTVVGSFFGRTVLMVTTLTAAIALTSRSVLSEAGLDPSDAGNVMALTLATGLVMALAGLLRLGSIMSFVSNAVMTGFTTGIALQIIVGVVEDATGYEPQLHNTVVKLGEWLLHVGDWDGRSTAVAAVTLAVWAGARAVPAARSIATLIALLLVGGAVALIGADVEHVGDIASIPNSPPHLVLPDVAVLPKVALGGLAVALVALAQAAGIGAAVPNPDGSPTNASGDFLAQGVANVAGSFFQALPTGGSLSRTGVATSAHAETRWAGIFSGIWLIVVVLLAGRYAERIPMPVIGGLLLAIGGELIWGRRRDILLVWRAGAFSVGAMLATFLATTQLPLQEAIFFGAVLSLVLYSVKASRQAGFVALAQEPDGRWRVADLPARAPDHDITILYYSGVSLFAELARLDELWPDTKSTKGGVVILNLRTIPDVPSTTLLKAIERRARELRGNGSRLIVCGVTDEMRRVLHDSRVEDAIGRENVVQAHPVIMASLDEAMREARTWLAEGPAPRESP